MGILTEEQTKAILDGAMKQVRDSVIEEAKSQATWAVKTAVASRVTEIIRQFVEDEIKPEILASLTKNKSILIEAALASAQDMAVEIAKAMTETVAENLGTSYKRKKIMEALFD